MLTETASAQILSLFFLLKVEKQKHCLVLLLLWMLMEDKVLSKDVGLQHLAQVPCFHQATLPLLQGEAGASQMYVACASIQTTRGAQMRPGAQEATRLFFFTFLMICSICPCRKERSIFEKGMALLKVTA